MDGRALSGRSVVLAAWFGELLQQRAALPGEVAQLVAVGARVGLQRRELGPDLDQRGDLVGVHAGHLVHCPHRDAWVGATPSPRPPRR